MSTMDASAIAGGAGQFPEEDEMDEEEGDVVESAPPLQLGEERVIGGTGIKKKLLKVGDRWETPEFGDEVTVHHVASFLDGTIYGSTREKGEPTILAINEAILPRGLEKCIMSMKRGEIALFTFLAKLGDVTEGFDDVPPDPVIIQYEIELISGGNKDGKPGALDEVLVRYQVVLVDDTVVAKTPDEGFEFCVKDGHLCPALPLAVVTMHPGEKAKLLVLPQYRFSDQPKLVLSIDLELVSFKPVIDVVGDSKKWRRHKCCR